MLVQEALYIHLTADAAVSAACPGGIHAGILTQTVTYPAAAYRKVSREQVGRIEDRGHSGLALQRFRFFSTCNLAEGGYDACKALDEAIRLSLQGYRGTVTDTSVSPNQTLELFGIFQQSSFDMYDDPTQTFQVITDYDVWAEELQPTP